MDRLIQDVLRYSRIARADMPLARINLQKLAAELIHRDPELSPFQDCIQIQQPLLPVLGNESALLQCLANLLGNAVKFVASGTRPAVRIWDRAAAWRLRVPALGARLCRGPRHWRSTRLLA